MQLKLTGTLAICFALLLASSPTRAQVKRPDLASENKLLSAFILNISKFTTWKNLENKSQANSKLHFVVIDNPALAEELTALADSKKIKDHEVEVRSLPSDKVEREAGELIILIPNTPLSSRSIFINSLKKLKGCHCLTVTYEEGMAAEGSTVNFFTNSEHLRFEINLNRAKEEGIELSSQLLKLGKLVE